GFEIRRRLGDRVESRARAAAATLPPDAVLAGLSFGAGLACELWHDRPATAGVLLLHGVGAMPEAPRPGTPVELHLAEPDPFEDEDWIRRWVSGAAADGAAVAVHRYPGVGHLFTDPTLPDHDAAAAASALDRALAFLEHIETPSLERLPR
ncbi:MAG: dienelactone hydrolase family protein, partial [Amaricoccus sp.]